MGSYSYSVLLCSTFSLLVVANTVVESLRVCESVKKVSFLGFVPCQTGFQLENRFLSQKSEALRECDALVQAAIEVAVERINGDPNILTNVTLEVLQLSDINARSNKVSSSN